MSIRKNQEEFISIMQMVDCWSERFTILVEMGGDQPSSAPADLLSFRISNCQSRTYFRAENWGGMIHISGWSNSMVLAGIIVAMKRIFEGSPVRELQNCSVFFHTDSGLINNVTPLRGEAILEMVHRIAVLYPG